MAGLAPEKNEKSGFNGVEANETEKGILSRLAEGSSRTAGKALRTMTFAAMLLGSGMLVKEANADPHPRHNPEMSGVSVEFRINPPIIIERSRSPQPGDAYKHAAMKRHWQGEEYKHAATGHPVRMEVYDRTDVAIDRIAERMSDGIVDGLFGDK